MNAVEVSAHCTRESCWIVINERVYDVTDFIDAHPGGAGVILRYAGQDATEAFNEVHTLRIIDEYLPAEKHLGNVIGKLDKNGTTANQARVNNAKSDSAAIPPLATRVALDDFEEVAKRVLPEKAWIYASSSSNSDQRMNWYRQVWSQLIFRPRVLRNVSIVDSCSKMLCLRSRHPFFIPPMGVLGTVHPEGELAVVRAAARAGIHCCVSTATTRDHEELMEAFSKEQLVSKSTSEADENNGALFFQLYVNSHREVTRRLLQRIRAIGYKGLFITADTPVVGKRNEDRRLQARELAGLELGSKKTTQAVQGGRAPPGVLSSSLNWEDLEWIRQEWSGPIVIKGVQSAADVFLAAKYGVHGVYLSNHGGRQLQDAPSSLDTLLELRQTQPELLQKLEIYVDGGFRTGADVLKALCLGATAVGIGRPFIYAIAGYGTGGATRAINILAEEVEMGMRFLGVNAVDQLRPELVHIPQARFLSAHL